MTVGTMTVPDLMWTLMGAGIGLVIVHSFKLMKRPRKKSFQKILDQHYKNAYQEMDDSDLIFYYRTTRMVGRPVSPLAIEELDRRNLRVDRG